MTNLSETSQEHVIVRIVHVSEPSTLIKVNRFMRTSYDNLPRRKARKQKGSSRMKPRAYMKDSLWYLQFIQGLGKNAVRQ